MLNPALKSGFL